MKKRIYSQICQICRGTMLCLKHWARIKREKGVFNAQQIHGNALCNRPNETG